MRTSLLKRGISMLLIFLLAGWVASAYSQCSVMTDKEDYYPGENVIITGTGWMPGETVNILIQHLVFPHPDETWDLEVGSDGSIYDISYIIDPWDLGETFLLTATGETSGCIANTTFTDGKVTFIAKIDGSHGNNNELSAEVEYSINVNVQSQTTKTTYFQLEAENNSNTYIYFRYASFAFDGSSQKYYLTGAPGGDFEYTTSGYYPYYAEVENGNNFIWAYYISCADDDVPPTPIAQNITINLNEQGVATIEASDVDNGSFDNCEIASMSVTPNSFTCENIGENTVTLTVTDVKGNSDSETATVTVLDNGLPVAVTKNITVYLDQNGSVSITPADVDDGSYDNCTFNLTLSKSSFDCSETGENIVTLTITDASGNSDSETAKVTVQDNMAPIVVIQNITVELDENGEANITPEMIDNGSTDNCAIDTYVLDVTNFDCEDIGVNTVTLTVTDVNDNVASANAQVTVQDNMAPTVVTKNIEIELDASGNASIVATDVNDGSWDNCGIASMSVSPNSFTCENIGENTVTLTVTDVNDNVASANAQVTVQDNMAPIVVIQNITVELDENGEANITPEMIDNGSTDNCAIDTYVLDVTSFDCEDIGVNTVTLTVTDVNDNVASANAQVTVQDNMAPTVVTKNIEIELDASGNASIVATDVDDGSWDNCGIASMSVSPNSFTCENIGENTVTLTVTDVNENSASLVALVTVQDNIDPIVVIQDIIVELDENGEATITPEMIENGSTDNCAIDTYALDVTSFDCEDIGVNIVTLTVTDVNDNVVSATAQVTVQDNMAPTVVTKNIEIELDASGNASIVATDVDDGSWDNCGIASMSVSPNSFTCENIGENTVILTVTDVKGNSDSKTATVTVLDNELPVAVTKNITVYLDQNGSVSIAPADVDDGSYDNCTFNLTLSKSSFDCSETGENIVTLTITDASGNSDSETAKVTVQDNMAPTVVTKNIEIELDASGNASIVAADVDDGSWDNCGIASMNVSPYGFTCDDLGNNTVSLTVIDVYGNSASNNAIVTVTNPISIEYTGTTIQSTAPGSNSANVQLVAIVDGLEGCEIDADCIIFNFTPSIGNEIITGANIVPIAGTNKYKITKTVNISIGDAPFIVFDVEVIAGCNFDGETSAIITVYKPNGDMVTGGGYIIPVDSEGSYPATAGEKANFGFNVKNKPSGIQGDMNYKFDSEGREFQVKATEFTSLGVVSYEQQGYKIAEFSAIATLSSSKKGKLEPINEPNLTLVVTLTDNGEPGDNDKIGFTLWKGDVLMHSSWWLDYYTGELPIGGGNLVVHKGLLQSSEFEPIAELAETLTATPLSIFPNPASDKATFKFIPEADGKARLDIYSISGTHVATVYDADVIAGNEYKLDYTPTIRNNAVLLYRLILNNEVYTGKLLFQ